MNRIPLFFAAVFLSTGFLFSQVPVSYVVDSTQSVVTISGELAGIALQEQGPDSLSTRYSGTIDAELDDYPITSSITLSSNSMVIAENSGSWRPQQNGAAGSAPANYGFDAEGPVPPELAALIPSNAIPAGVSITGVSIESAIRNLELTFDPTPLQIDLTGSLQGTQIVARVVTGDVAVGVSVIGTIQTPFGPFQAPPIQVTNFTFAITNTVATNTNPNASIMRTNGIETIMIDLDNLLAFSAVTTNDSFFQLQGHLVASRILPPPPMNFPPSLPPNTNFNVIAGQGIGVMVNPFDPDPGQITTLSYSGIPVVVTSNGFTWVTTASDAFTVQRVDIIATDNGSPNLSATQTITFVVAGMPIIEGFTPSAASRDISFPAMPGFDYDLEVSPQLGSNALWTVADTVSPTNMTGLVSDPAPCTTNQFYRVRIR